MHDVYPYAYLKTFYGFRWNWRSHNLMLLADSSACIQVGSCHSLLCCFAAQNTPLREWVPYSCFSVFISKEADYKSALGPLCLPSVDEHLFPFSDTTLCSIFISIPELTSGNIMINANMVEINTYAVSVWSIDAWGVNAWWSIMVYETMHLYKSEDMEF